MAHYFIASHRVSAEKLSGTYLQFRQGQRRTENCPGGIEVFHCLRKWVKWMHEKKFIN